MLAKRSVAFTVALVLVSVITAGLVVAAVIGLVAARAQLRAELRAQTERHADRLAAGLALPLWNLYDAQVERILEAALQEPEVFGAEVRAEGQSFALHRGPAWQVLQGSAASRPPGLLSAERRITYGGQEVGTLLLHISPRFVEAQLRAELWRQLLQITAIDLVLILALYVLLRRKVLAPLAEVGAYAAAVSRGALDRGTIGERRYVGELEGLRASIGQMVAQLETRYAEAAESERRFRALFNGGTDAAFVLAVTPDGGLDGLTEVNDVACRLLERTREALLQVGRLDPHVVGDFVAEGVLARTLQGERVVYETTLTTRSGRALPVEVSSSLLEYQGSKALLLQARDLSERKRAEAERERLQEDLRQAQKMESIGWLAGGVAHDLNNLLCPILSYGGMLTEDLDPGDDRRDLADDIVKAGGRARDLVRQLLAFSRRQVLTVRPVSLNDVLIGFEKLLRRTLREDITIELRPHPEAGAIRADVGQMEQVLLNLAVNAGDAMPSGGRLTIATRPAGLDEGAAAELGLAPGQYLVLTVSDTGSGMDEETRRHAFEPFFTTKKERGTGLGLATVFGIVKQHGGAIAIASQPGQGTTFTIHLPRTEERPEVEAPPTRPLRLDGAETVLLVDDDPQVREAARTILARRGYRVLLARSGDEALAVLEAQPTAVQLVVTDVVMPGMSGKELVARAQARRPELKALFMSGYTWEVISHHGVLDAGTQLLPKPFSAQTLAASVREVLDGGAPA